MSKTSSELISYNCPCGKIIKVPESQAKWSKWTRCECGERALIEGYYSEGEIKNRDNGTGWK